ncbi:MAG: T9SS type A sorting domain-containing protein [bacterium]|nr:T9SS type A sorting domain-containing protein [bacterium]
MMTQHTGNGGWVRRTAWVWIVALAMALGAGLAGATAAGGRGGTRDQLPVTITGGQSLTNEALLDSLQRTAFNYFWYQANPVNGLIRDRSQVGSPCSIAAQGFGITAICIGIEHGWVTREVGRARIKLGMQTLWNGAQGPGAAGVNGYKGLFYHFLDINSGNRTWTCELSTIDTALLMAGVLDAKQYFHTSDPGDVEIRALADSLYRRVDWNWSRNNGPAIRMGWKPETGFNTFGNWIGYNEAMILYVLALGSPTYPVPASTWNTWTSGYGWATYYGQSYLIFPPLFGHQYSHCWIDFRGIPDAYMAARGIDYFENSRRATYAARSYCIANPYGHSEYGENLWGLTASDDPGGYLAHGAPPAQNDNGTITPTAAASSIAFAPEIVLPCLHNMYDNWGWVLWGKYGFKDAFNPTVIWAGTDWLGIDQGPIIIMIENYLNGSVWDRYMQNPQVAQGLKLAGFQNVSAAPQPGPGRLTGIDLDQNSPNPFHGSTVISFRVAQSGPVSLKLYDLRGRLVRHVEAEATADDLQQITLDGRGLPSGAYAYSLESHGRKEWKRCIVVK